MPFEIYRQQYVPPDRLRFSLDRRARWLRGYHDGLGVDLPGALQAKLMVF
jgi:hypothetical protein